MATDIIGVKGADIRAARYAKGLKVYELAAIVRVNPSHLSAIERGTKTGSPALLVRIAEALGTDPSNFISNRPIPRAA